MHGGHVGQLTWRTVTYTRGRRRGHALASCCVPFSCAFCRRVQGRPGTGMLCLVVGAGAAPDVLRRGRRRARTCNLLPAISNACGPEVADCHGLVANHRANIDAPCHADCAPATSKRHRYRDARGRIRASNSLKSQLRDAEMVVATLPSGGSCRYEVACSDFGDLYEICVTEVLH